MRVAFVSQPRDAMAATGSQRGSVAIVTWELARRLTDRHDVTIYAPRLDNELEEERGVENVLIRRTSRAFRRVHKAIDFGTGLLCLKPPYFARPVFFREYGVAIADWLARDTPDVVHLQICSQFIPVIRRSVPRARIVFHTHDELLTRLNREMMERRLSMADAVVTCSDYVTERWRARFPRFAGKIHTVGNGVDLDRFQPDPESPTESASPAENTEVLYVGRVSPEKGVHILVQAFEYVAAAIPAARLTIIGSAGLLPFNQISLLEDDPHVAALRPFYGRGLVSRVRRQVMEARNGYLDAIRASVPPATLARVLFHGPLEYMDLPALYRRAQLLAAPSLCEEPFGLPLAEAMASGLPVVASRAGGMAGIVDDGRTGRLVERGDVKGLAHAMIEMLRDPAALAGMGHASRLTAVSRFGWKAAAGRLDHIYESLSGAQ
jgi:glycosyltransferase involved in cell wall biosynthesis